MAYGRDDNRDISDPWRVSLLIRAVVELVSALSVLVCAILSITTIKVVKASKLFPPFVSSSELRNVPGGRGTGDTVVVANGRRRKLLLEFGEQQASDSDTFEICGSPTPLTIRCEDCALALCDCACSSERPTVVHPRTDTDHTLSDVVGVIDSIQANYKLLSEDCTVGGQINQQYLGCFGTDTITIDPTSTCACGACDSSSSGKSRTASTDDISPSSGTALERKFEEVFFNESKGSNGSNRNDFAQDCTLNVRLDCGDGYGDGPRGRDVRQEGDSDASSSSQLPSDGRLEDSPRDSSQESFLYSRRSSAAPALLAIIGRGGDHISIDSDLLCGDGDTSSETERENEGKEEDGSGVHAGGDDYEMHSVIELKEALRQEQEALAAVYEELDEERSASCSAAHEAMAMINRLQEEKAAVQMEARQYQRMAEEKQHYDQEALIMLQEILVLREEEMNTLEEEVDMYRKGLLLPGRGLEDSQLEAYKDYSNDGKSPTRLTNDVAVVERDATVMEKSDLNRSMRRDSLLDEKLVAEIKDWLFAAREKGVPAKVEDLDVPGSAWSQASIGTLRIDGDGRKNLLDSFRSVASAGEEEYHRDDAVKVMEEAADTYKEAPAVSNAFQGMMDSLRQQPSLRDEESLQTLKKIEEKFQRQSSKEKARSEEELRRVWKSTLRSFESDDAAEIGETAAEVDLSRAAISSLTMAQRPASSVDEPATNDLRTTESVSNFEEDRTTEEKRLSVLEYVEKFEEQLHLQRLAGKKARPLQSAKSAMPVPPSIMEGEWEDSLAAAAHLGGSDSKQKSSSSPGDNGDGSSSRPSLVKSRLRKLAAGARNVALKAKRDSLKALSRQSSVVVGDVVDSRLEETGGKSNSHHHEGGQNSSHGANTNVNEATTGNSTHGGFQDSRTTFTNRNVAGSASERVTRVIVDSDRTDNCTEDFRVGGEEHQSQSLSRDSVPVDNSCNGIEVEGEGMSENGTRPVEESQVCEAKATAAQLSSRNVSDMSQSRAGTAVPLSSAVADPNAFGASAGIDDVVRQLTDRLKSLEEDRQIMQDTITALRKENGEMKFMQEIAQQLSEFGGVDQTGWSGSLESWPSDNPSAKGTASVIDLRHTVRSQLMNKVAQLFLGSGGDPGGAFLGDQREHVGLCRLLHRSPLSNQVKPFERTRSFRATAAGFPSSSSLADTAGVHGQAFSRLNTAVSLPAALLAYGGRRKSGSGVERVDQNS